MSKPTDSQDFDAKIEDFRKLLQERSCRQITNEDAREALENLKGFFQILQEWDDAEKNKGRKQDSLPDSS